MKLNIRSSLLVLIILHFTFRSTAQPEENINGVYTAQGTERITIAPWGSAKAMFLSDGHLFALKPESDYFLIGKTLGNTGETIGKLFFQVTGEKKNISIHYKDGRDWIAEKVLLAEKRIEFNNGNQHLVGELILPAGMGPFPLIVHTHGSGEETREASRGMAYLFASNGIASFIFDKRGCGESSGKEWRAAFKDYAQDLLAAVETLSKQPDIDSKYIGIFGHSQGGWVVPLAYSLKPNKVAFCIISAANAVSPVEENLYAGDEEFRLRGFDDLAIKEVHEFRKIKYEVGITGKGMNEYKRTILPDAEKKPWFKLTGGNLPDNMFWKENGFYDAAPALSALTCPVLVLYAEEDISTDSNRNLPRMKQLIPSADTTYVLFKHANHAMLSVAEKNFTSKQLETITRFADGYLEQLITWTKKTILHLGK